MASEYRRCVGLVLALICAVGLATPLAAQTFTFTDDPLNPQVTLVKAVHIAELRAAVDTLRSAAGLATFSFSVVAAGTTVVQAVHVTELRTALNAVYDAVGTPRPTYTDVTPVAGATLLKGAHIAELRTAVNSLQVPVSGLAITSLGAMSSAPAKLLTVNGVGFDPAARMRVTFTDSANRAAEIPAIEVSATSLTVPVPPFVSAAGQLSTGVVGVQVKKVATTTTTSNTVAGFQILAAPTLPLPAGTLAKSFLDATRSEALALKNEPIDAVIKTGLNTNIEHAGQLVAKVQSVIDDPTKTFSLGSINGKPVTVGAADLAQLDRILLAMVQNMAAPAGSAGVGATDVTALELGSECMAQGAAAVAQAVAAGEDPGVAEAIHQARASLPCQVAVAFNTTYLLVGGAGAIGLGALALLGATPMALGIAGASMIYITVMLAGGQIAIGGALNQTTGGGGQLVQQGVDAFNGMLEGLVVGLTPVGDVAGIIQGINDVSTALTEKPLPPPAPAPTGPGVTAIAFTSTGSTTSARVSPVRSGVSVHYSVVGTDGYYQSGTLTTNATGAISFFVSAGAAGVRDTVIVTVVGGPSATTTHVWGGSASGQSAAPRVSPPRQDD